VLEGKGLVGVLEEALVFYTLKAVKELEKVWD